MSNRAANVNINIIATISEIAAFFGTALSRGRSVIHYSSIKLLSQFNAAAVI